MKLRTKHIIEYVLCLLLLLGSIPNVVWADDEEIQGDLKSWIDPDHNIWVNSSEYALNCIPAGVPEEYGDDYYNDAYCADVILSNVDKEEECILAIQSIFFFPDEIDYHMETGYGLISSLGSSYENVGDYNKIIADAKNHYSEDEEAFLFNVQLDEGEAQLVVFLYLDECVDEDITGYPIVLNVYSEEAFNKQIRLIDVNPSFEQLENIPII